MKPNVNDTGPRVAIVTGAAGTIGGAVVRRLADDGWRVAGIDLKKCDAELSLRVDVSDRNAMLNAADEVAKTFGHTELLMTAAADFEKIPFGDMALSRWQRMLDVWLGGTANACAAVVPQMIKAGCGTAVLLSAVSGPRERKNSYIAAASGSVVAFAKSLGCEVAADGVCVNCVAIQPPANAEWVARMTSFLANDGQYYAGQVMFLNSDVQSERGQKQ